MLFDGYRKRNRIDVYKKDEKTIIDHRIQKNCLFDFCGNYFESIMSFVTTKTLSLTILKIIKLHFFRWSFKNSLLRTSESFFTNKNKNAHLNLPLMMSTRLRSFLKIYNGAIDLAKTENLLLLKLNDECHIRQVHFNCCA